MLKDHEKFWAFTGLIFSIVILAVLGKVVGDNQSQTIRDAIIGLIGIAGAAGQALFRVSGVDQKNAETAGILAQTASTAQNSLPSQVEVVNTVSDPVPVSNGDERQ